MGRLLSRLLVLLGTALLVWCGFIVIDGYWSQRQARDALTLALSLPPPPRLDSSLGVPQVLRSPMPPPSRGDALATLSIPRVGLSAVVLHGSDSRTLRRGPGHLEATALPGQAGNVVIAGHRDTFFRSLQFARRGDDVFLDSSYGRVRYRVDSMTVVPPTDVSVVAPTRQDTLTLITCYPFWVWGNAPDRYVVRATRVGDERKPVATGGTSTPTLIDVPHGRPRALAPRHPDADTLVRDALARFRAAYNARLASHPDGGTAAPLAFTGCDTSIEGDAATASCRAAAPASTDATVWTFTLQRAGDQWAIRSVVRN